MVTGGTGLLGRATAHGFACEGFEVVLAEMAVDGLGQVAAEVQALGVLTVVADVADPGATDRPAEQARARASAGSIASA